MIMMINKERHGLIYYASSIDFSISFYFRTLYELMLFKKFIDSCDRIKYCIIPEPSIIDLPYLNRKRYIPRYNDSWITNKNIYNLVNRLIYFAEIHISDFDCLQDFYDKFNIWMIKNNYQAYTNISRGITSEYIILSSPNDLLI